MGRYSYDSGVNERLRVIRKALQKSQAKIAEDIGYSNAYYSKLEQPGSRVGDNVIIALCNVFDVNLAYLLTGKLPIFVEHSVLEKELIQKFNRLSPSFQSLLLQFAETMETADMNGNGTNK